jgi:hypothetical protein
MRKGRSHKKSLAFGATSEISKQLKISGVKKLQAKYICRIFAQLINEIINSTLIHGRHNAILRFALSR